MRKLAATTALATIAMAGSAGAAEWETTVSGFYHLGLALSDSDAQDGVGVLRDGEVHIDGRLFADNGLVFAAHVEIEAHTSDDQIDKNWGSVRGAFGRLKIGGDDMAIAAYHNGNIESPGTEIGYFDANPITAAADDMGVVAGGEQGVGFHYDSPEFMGFQVGFSYEPDIDADEAGDNNAINFSDEDYWSIAAAYEGEFENFGFGLSGGYADSDGPNNDVWNVGGFVSTGGFTFAGGYQDGADAFIDGAAAGETFYFGAEYSTGPWTVAGGYSNNNLNDTDVAAAWVTYRIAPGVSATGGLEYADDATTEDFGGILYMSLLF